MPWVENYGWATFHSAYFMLLTYSNLVTWAVPFIYVWLVEFSLLPSSKKNVHYTLFGLLMCYLPTFLLHWRLWEDGAPSTSCFTLSSIPERAPSAHSAVTTHFSEVRIEKAAALSISGVALVAMWCRQRNKAICNWTDAGLNLSSDCNQTKDLEPVTYLQE